MVTSAVEDARGSKARGWPLALGVTVVAAVGIGFAFTPGHAGRPHVLIALAAVNAVLLAAGCWWLFKHNLIHSRLMPRRGDITIGALLAAGSYLLLLVAHFGLTAPGRFGNPWLFRLILQLGDPDVVSSFAVGVTVMLIAAAEEVVWRGWVQAVLGEVMPAGRATLATAGLYALAHVATLYLLRDPVAGLNPLLVLAALGYGLIWGVLTQRIDRVMPSMFAHALFTWSVVEFPIWRM